jgi:hypothetical protein
MVMELTLRPYITAGVVLAGAGLIAAVPIGPPAPEIQTRAVHLASVDDLGDPTSAASLADNPEFPLVSWADAYSDTTSNLQSLDAQIAADPNPILSAVDANLTNYANELASAAQLSSSNFTNLLQDLSTVLTNATSDLQAGDVYDAETSIWQFLLTDPGTLTRPFESAYFDISQSMVNNLDNLLTPGGVLANATSDIMQIFAIPQWVTDLQEASLYGPNAAEYAMAGVTQDVLNAYQSGDLTLALNDLSNAPSTIFDAYLNGYQVDGGVTAKDLTDLAVRRPGLNPSLGALNGGSESVLRAKEIIAGDLGGAVRAQDTLASAAADPTAAASSTADLNAIVGDVSTLLNPSTALGEIATAFDPNAVADISSLLTADLAPNASGWVVDLFALF